MDNKAQWPGRSDARVQLSQRSGGGIARVGELLVTGGGLATIERDEFGLEHVNLTAHLGDIGRVGWKHLRQPDDMADIGRDIFADSAIAPRCPGNQLTTFITQAGGQAVDFGLGEQRDRFIIAQPQKTPDPTDKIARFVIRKNIIKAEHRAAVRHLAKAGSDRRADLAARAVIAHQMRKLRLDGGIAADQRVIITIADAWCILGVVAPVVHGNLGSQQRQFCAGIGIGLGHRDHAILIASPCARREGAD